MFNPKIQISKLLMERLKEAAEQLGCTVEELAEKAIEKEVDRVLSRSGKKEASEAEVEDIANRLKGLGYLD